MVLSGDVNGDGRDDLLAFDRGWAGDVWVSLSTGNGFSGKTKWHGSFCYANETPMVGDVDGDGRADILSFRAGTSPKLQVSLSQGDRFSPHAAIWSSGFPSGGTLPRLGDIDGDGRTDLVGFVRDSEGGGGRGDVLVAFADGSGGFGPPAKWHDFFCIGDEVPIVADVNGDGRDDVLACTRGMETLVFGATNRGDHFLGTGKTWHYDLCRSDQTPHAGRFNHDLNADLICLPEDSGYNATLSLAGGHAQPAAVDAEGFGYGTMGVPFALPEMTDRKPRVHIPVLAVLIEVEGRPTFASKGRPRSFWDQWIFGPGDPSIVNFFHEMSGGKLRFTKGGLIGPISIDAETFGTTDVRVTLKQRLRDLGFDFRRFDENGDGVITNSELIIMQIDNWSEQAGQAISPWETVDHEGTSLLIKSTVAKSSYLGHFDLYAHELSHALGTIDFYGSSNNCAALSLMAGAPPRVPTSEYGRRANEVITVYHLESYHKMRLGWLRPDAYDVRYPGGSVIANAQRAAFTPSEPPVVLYDPARGTNEYYLAEYRTNTWDDGIAVAPGYQRAGYDTRTAGRGVALWYLNTHDGSHNPIERFSAIVRGPDDVLQTRPASGSDDLIPDGYLYIDPGPDGILQTRPDHVLTPGPNGRFDSIRAGDDLLERHRIHTGPNRVLDTRRKGDDVVTPDDGLNRDFMAFTSITPTDHLSRRSNALWTRNRGAAEPRWFDNSPIGATVRVDEFDANSPVAFVQWGSRFAPWLERVSNRRVAAGSAVVVHGTLGVRSPGPIPVLIDSTGRPHDLEILSWHQGIRTELRIPRNAPSGPARILFYSDFTRNLVSNSLSLVVDNSYLDTLAEMMPELLLEHPETVDPWGDIDRDGLPNIGELLLGTRITDFDSRPPVRLEVIPGQGLGIHWSHTFLPLNLEVVAQFSEDLKNWEDIHPDASWQKEGGVQHSAHRAGGKQGYVRMLFRPLND